MKRMNYGWTLGILLTSMSLSCKGRPQIAQPDFLNISKSTDAEASDETAQDPVEQEPREESPKDRDKPDESPVELPAEEKPEPTPESEPTPLALYSKLKPKIFDTDCNSCHKRED